MPVQPAVERDDEASVDHFTCVVYAGVVGGLVGAAVGFFVFGVGAIPGALIGAKIGATHGAMITASIGAAITMCNASVSYKRTYSAVMSNASAVSRYDYMCCKKNAIKQAWGSAMRSTLITSLSLIASCAAAWFTPFATYFFVAHACSTTAPAIACAATKPILSLGAGIATDLSCSNYATDKKSQEQGIAHTFGITRSVCTLFSSFKESCRKMYRDLSSDDSMSSPA